MPISPSQGSTGGGSSVTFTGTNLGGATEVHFGSNPAVITANTGTSVSAVAPAGAGVVAATVTTLGGTSPPLPFYYVPPPVVLDLTPSSGGIAGGTTITITGQYLAAVTDVTVDGTTVTPTVVSDSVLTAVTPAHSPGPVAVVATTQGGTAAPVEFEFVSAPTVTGFSPVTGLPAGGTLVSITGTNLSTTTGVTFGGTSATFAVLSGTQIAAIAPTHALGAVSIVVTTTGGVATAPGTFLYLL
ncbi:IPT/TIG domain-containing protein [Streptomyces sp. NPDC056411]|uniref:IPT/TIG domain-containing protein n=1 Tax=Streptomyces sp. NPDC056411 TaxID=3345813 RepID=UPI0035DF03B1